MWPGQRPTTGSRCTPALQCLDAICTFGSPRSLATVSIFRFRFDASVMSSSKIRPDISMPGNRLRANSAAWEMAPALTKSTKPRWMRSPKGTVIRSKFQLEENDGSKKTASDGLRSGRLRMTNLNASPAARAALTMAPTGNRAVHGSGLAIPLMATEPSQSLPVRYQQGASWGLPGKSPTTKMTSAFKSESLRTVASVTSVRLVGATARPCRGGSVPPACPYDSGEPPA